MCEFLHNSQDDPREAIVLEMIKHLNLKGSIIAWGAKYERRIINYLVEALPQYKDELQAISARLVDPIPVFNSWYLHPATFGSASLKYVGPALLGKKASYSGLKVSDGMEAFATWDNWIFHNGAQDSETALKAYCSMDTLLPLQIIEILEEV